MKKNKVTYFTSFSNIIINIIKQLIEYCNVTSLNPKKDKLIGDNLCQHVGKCCCPKCILDKFSWYMPFLAWHHVAEKECSFKCLNRLKNVDWLLDKQVVIQACCCWNWPKLLIYLILIDLLTKMLAKFVLCFWITLTHIWSIWFTNLAKSNLLKQINMDNL